MNKWSGQTDEGPKHPVLQLSAVHVYSQRGACGVRGAVFRDIAYTHGVYTHRLHTWGLHTHASFLYKTTCTSFW